MASDIDLCNLALSHLGNEASIASFDEQSVEAEKCKVFYPIARGNILQAHDWSFATKRKSLALINNPANIPPDWSFAYALPSDNISFMQVLLPPIQTSSSVFSIFDLTFGLNNLPVGTANLLEEPYIIEEDATTGASYIYTNAEKAIGRYVFLQTNTAKYTPLFNHALSRLLSSYLAGPLIKGSEGMRIAEAQMSMYAKMDLPNATASDSQSTNDERYNNFVPQGIAARR